MFLIYIDDIFGFVTRTTEELQLFISSFPTFHTALQYTWSITHPATGVTLRSENSTLKTNIHYKPTDSSFLS